VNTPLEKCVKASQFSKIPFDGLYHQSSRNTKTMEKAELISKLNWFYSLELNQVDLDMAQSRMLRGTYESMVFERTAWIEQEHVDNIKKEII
jgi:hypothetical protein